MLNMRGNNDNDTWQPLSLAAGRLLLKLDEKKNVEGDRDADAGKSDDERDRENRAAVEEGLKRIAEFERRARGGQYRTRRNFR